MVPRTNGSKVPRKGSGVTLRGTRVLLRACQRGRCAPGQERARESEGEGERARERKMEVVAVQGYLAHKKPPPSLGPQ